MISIAAHGAIADKVTDNSVAIQAAFAEADLRNQPVFIPGAALPYRFSQTIVQTRCVPILGQGMMQSVLEYSGAGAGIRIEPVVATQWRAECRGSRLDQFAIVPSVDGHGDTGVEVNLRVDGGMGLGSFYSSFVWEQVMVGAFGGPSVRWANPLANNDGFFLGEVRNCWFGNGFEAAWIGDTISFTNNSFSGVGPVHITSNPNARRLTFERNSIISRGGVLFANSSGLRFNNNWIEPIDFTGEYALLDLRGSFTQASIKRNTITAMPGARQPFYDVLMVGPGSRVLIDENEFSGGTEAHVYATSQTSKIKVGLFNSYMDGAPRIVLQGADSVHG